MEPPSPRLTHPVVFQRILPFLTQTGVYYGRYVLLRLSCVERKRVHGRDQHQWHSECSLPAAASYSGVVIHDFISNNTSDWIGNQRRYQDVQLQRMAMSPSEKRWIQQHFAPVSTDLLA